MPGLLSPENPCLSGVDPVKCAVFNICYRGLLEGSFDHLGKAQRSIEIGVTLAGPADCSCSVDKILAMAYQFTDALKAFQSTTSTPPPTILPSAWAHPFCDGINFLPDAIKFPRRYDVWDFPNDVPEFPVYVKEITFSRLEKNCRTWIFRIDYDNDCWGSEPIEKLDGTYVGLIGELPEAVARVTHRSVQRSVPVEKATFQGLYDRHGRFVPVKDPGPDQRVGGSEYDVCCRPLIDRYYKEMIPINAAGVAFSNPPLKEIKSGSVIDIEKPYESVNGCAMDEYRGLVNCDTFYLLNVRRGKIVFCNKVLANTAKIVDITMRDDDFCDGTPIKWVKTTIEIKKGRKLTDANGNTIWSGWRDLVRNDGLAGMFCAGDKAPDGGEIPESREDGTLIRGQILALTDQFGKSQTEPQPLDTWGLPVTRSDDNVCQGSNIDNQLYLLYEKGSTAKFVETLPSMKNVVIWDQHEYDLINPSYFGLDAVELEALCDCIEPTECSTTTTTTTTQAP